MGVVVFTVKQTTSADENLSDVTRAQMGTDEVKSSDVSPKVPATDNQMKHSVYRAGLSSPRPG